MLKENKKGVKPSCESLFLGQVTGNYLWTNKERTFHASAWTCRYLFSSDSITSLYPRRTSTSSSICLCYISTFYVILYIIALF